MKIAYFTESLPPKIDGVARTLTQLGNSLYSKKIDFRFYSPFKPGKEIPWAEKVVEVSSLPFILYPECRVGLSLQRPIFASLDDFQPDLIHASCPTPMGFVAFNYAAENKIPAVSSYHTNFATYFRYYGFRRVEHWGWNYLKWFYNKFLKIYVPSKNTAQELENKGFQNIELWERGIHLNRYSPEFRCPKIRKRYSPNDKPILLYVGRLVKEKDLEDLVAMNQILKNRGRDFEMVFVGDGPMKAELQELLPDAHFTGYMEGEKLATLYASADIFVFPSTTETFGNVILEAFASGLPVITVNKGGVVDLIRVEENGFIARANDPKDLSEKVDILLMNPTLRHFQAISARNLVQYYSWEAINNRLINSYEELLSKVTKN
jgi:glycosyltransferase involved in cell wall biosynthesis